MEYTVTFDNNGKRYKTYSEYTKEELKMLPPVPKRIWESFGEYIYYNPRAKEWDDDESPGLYCSDYKLYLKTKDTLNKD